MFGLACYDLLHIKTGCMVYLDGGFVSTYPHFRSPRKEWHMAVSSEGEIAPFCLLCDGVRVMTCRRNAPTLRL